MKNTNEDFISEHLEVYLEFFRDILKQKLLNQELEEIDIAKCRQEAFSLTKTLIYEFEQCNKQRLLTE